MFYGSLFIILQELLLKELLMILIWLYRNWKKQDLHMTGSTSTVMGSVWSHDAFCQTCEYSMVFYPLQPFILKEGK